MVFISFAFVLNIGPDYVTHLHSFPNRKQKELGLDYSFCLFAFFLATLSAGLSLSIAFWMLVDSELMKAKV